eukprot:TRINITY_DN80678_c0_g1_i1.p1 TRINITY_DN80678_c0_g1~~TRINITY_DN80678_c0_g1_i1.p1  ORF type:complete len:621 (-),score=153.67 TRINITY_DN80678_c0_g1_i1:157-2019(-)
MGTKVTHVWGVGTFLWYLVLLSQPWSNLKRVRKTCHAGQAWKIALLAVTWLVPVFFAIPVFLVTEPDAVQVMMQWGVASWFIAFGVLRALNKRVFDLEGFVTIGPWLTVLLDVGIIATAFIPPLTQYTGDYATETVRNVLELSEKDPALKRVILIEFLDHLWWLTLCHMVTWLLMFLCVIEAMIRYNWLMGHLVCERPQKQSPPLHQAELGKVLIIHASVGAGHKMAALAIKDALAEQRPDCQVEVIDIMDFTGKLFNTIYKKSYLKLVNKSWGAYLMGYLFDSENREPPGFVKLLFECIFLFSFVEFLYRNDDWDLIIHTHFLSQEILCAMRKRKQYNTPHVAVVTDFDAHAWWSVQPLDQWFVAREETALQLCWQGVPREKVTVSGIPIKPAFSKCLEKPVCIQELELEGKKPMVLLMSYGPGVVSAYKHLLEVEEPLEVVVITGRQADIRSELEAVTAELDTDRHTIRLEGFTTKMEHYLKCADIVITKPGGLTTSECLASGAAIVIVNPYPGQEVRNSDMLLEMGCATKVTDIYLLGFRVGEIVRDKERLERMKRNALALGKPNAVFDVITSCEELVRAHRKTLSADGSSSDCSEVDDEGSDLDPEPGSRCCCFRS